MGRYNEQKNKQRRNAKRVHHVGPVNDAVCLNEARDQHMSFQC